MPEQEPFIVFCPEIHVKREWAETVMAWDHEGAAEAWAEEQDNEETPTIALGQITAQLFVTDKSGDEKEFEVSGRYEPIYSAREVTSV